MEPGVAEGGEKGTERRKERIQAYVFGLVI